MKEKIAELKGKVSGGVSPAMATPLLADGYSVNTAVIPQLVDFLIAANVSGLFVAGTTGEGILLDEAQRMRLLESTVTAANGRLPIIVHTGTVRTDSTLRLSQHAAQLGVDAVAVVPPYFYGIHNDSLFDYYTTITAAIPETPLFLYDIPHLAINGISPSLLNRLHEACPSIAGVKTSRLNAQDIRLLLDSRPEETIILAGNERIALGSLAMGADGLITGVSTAIPELFVGLTDAVANSDVATAQKWHRAINKMLDMIPAGERIGAIKSILTARGIDVGTAVPPRPMPKNLNLWSKIQPLLD